MSLFYLGSTNPSWFKLTTVPLFLSHRRLHKKKTFYRARGNWCLDSGGFSELSLFGEWRTTEDYYVEKVKIYNQEIGNLVWAAPQDWMCEPFIIEKTGLSIEIHQERTIDSFISLKSRCPEVHWTPILQGWEPADYNSHIEQYLRRGIDLREEEIVGLGSVCRRQGLKETIPMIRDIVAQGISLHGLGFKKLGLRACADILTSSDSAAWSFHARRNKIRLAGHTHQVCNDCLEYALIWRNEVMQIDGLE